jgi:hypothetical protein
LRGILNEIEIDEEFIYLLKDHEILNNVGWKKPIDVEGC